MTLLNIRKASFLLVNVFRTFTHDPSAVVSHHMCSPSTLVKFLGSDEIALLVPHCKSQDFQETYSNDYVLVDNGL
jgi:hypothetical protein